MSNPVCLGLDFGTSNSVATLWRDGQVESVRFPDGTLQRTLFFLPEDPDGVVEGETTRILLGNRAADAYFKNRVAGRLIQSIKSHLASSVDELSISGIVVGIEALVGVFLRFMREGAASYAGLPVEALDHVVLGRPVRFHVDPVADARAEKRLATAARLAGFTSVAFQYEPVAAALDYERHATREELVLVGDLGGGTSDFAIVRVGPGRGLHDRARDVVATSGVPLAGNALDRDVMRHHVLDHFGGGATWRFTPEHEEAPWRPNLLHEVVDLPRVPLLRLRRNEEYLRRVGPRVNPRIAATRLTDLIFKSLAFSVAEAIEAAKIELSAAQSSRVVFAEESVDLDRPLTREQYEATTRSTVERIVASLDEVLDRAGVEPAGISRVFLTGGTSQVPALRRAFDERFGAERVFVGEVFTSVANGLARSWPLAFEPSARRTVEMAPERADTRARRYAVQRLRAPTPEGIRRYLGQTLREPVAPLNGDSIAYLFSIAAAGLPEPLATDFRVWTERAEREIAGLSEEESLTLLQEIEALPPAQVPPALRSALGALQTHAGAVERLLLSLQDSWEGVPFEPIALLQAAPAPAKAAAKKERAPPSPTLPPKPGGGRENVAEAKEMMVARLRLSKEGLRESILLDSLRASAAHLTQADVEAALGQLRREKRVRTSGGRWVLA